MKILAKNMQRRKRYVCINNWVKIYYEEWEKFYQLVGFEPTIV